MKQRGHRFLASTLGTLAAASATGRLAARREARRPDPECDEPLGAIRGEGRWLRGSRGSSLYTEFFPAADGGAGNGTVIFTHGWCMTEAMWHYQKRDLAGNGFSMVTWDLPGHGHSEPLSSKHLSLERAVDALDRVVETYRDGDILLAGHSLGGVITLGYLAQRSETCRKAVRGAVLVSTPMMHVAHSIAGRWPGARIEARALGRMMQFVVESGIAERLLAGDVGQSETSRLSYRVVRVGFGRNPSPAQVRFARDMIASVAPRVRADTFRTMTGYDIRWGLSRIKVPTLVVIGARDRLVNPEESHALAARLPRGRELVLEDAGHAAFIESHERFNAEVRRFVERRLAPRRARSA